MGQKKQDDASNPTYVEAGLKRMKTSKLWTVYTKAGCGVTRSKDRPWLIESILAAQEARGGPEAPAPEPGGAPPAPPPLDDDETEEDTHSGTPPDDEIRSLIKSLDAGTDIIDAMVVGEAIELATRARALAANASDTATSSAWTRLAELADEPTAYERINIIARAWLQPVAPPTLKGMSVKDLRALYVEEIGRPTKSKHRGYLMWKIREARKGNVPTGPSSRRKSRDPDVKMMVLPLRVAEPDVQAIDAAWGRLGFKSRMAFLREAMGCAAGGQGRGDGRRDGPGILTRTPEPSESPNWRLFSWSSGCKEAVAHFLTRSAFIGPVFTRSGRVGTRVDGVPETE